MISDWQSWWWRWFQPRSIAMMGLTILAAIGWHSKPRITNLQCCLEPTLFCFLPGVSWRANHQSCHWCRKRHIVSRIAILLHCRIGDLLSPLSSARLWCLVSVSRWLFLIYMCKYMGLHLGLQDMSELMASLMTTVLAEVLPGVLCVRGVQREFEDLLAALIFSPVRWV